MNNENLKPMSERTAEERRELTRRGGIASGQARREKKTIRQRLALLMEEPAAGENETNGDKVAAALMKKAAAGDLKAIRLIGEYMGEFTQRVELEQTIKDNPTREEIINALREGL